MSVCCRTPSDERCASEPRSAAANRDGRAQSAGQRAAVTLLLLYKTALSPLFPSACKFYPTCSAYAREAVERHGARRGLLLAIKRLLRCRPFSPGGIDPVPDSPLHDA